MIDDLSNTELPVGRAITRINGPINSDIDYEHHLDWDQYNIYTWYNDTWGKTPRMYRSQEWDDLEPGDIDDQGHEHPVRFLIVHKDNQGLTCYEKQNALRNLGIYKADTEHYGLVKYTDDWQYSGGGTEDFPLTLTRSAIVDLFMNTATEERESIAESALRAEDAAISAAASAAQAEDAAERALVYYGGYSRIMPLEPYLYEIWYNTLDYKYAFDYFSTQDIEPNVGGCTAVRSGSVYGRNYDWTYDDKAEFMVHTSAQDGRHAVLGIATNVPGLTDEFVRSLQSSESYKLVPFRLVDGMNDAGLVMNVNVVPVQDNEDPYKNRHINYSADHKITLCLSMLIRFVLDNFSTVDEAIEYITNNVNLYYSTPFIRDHGYEYHYLIADKFGTTKCIEFKDAEISAFSCQEHPYITNFHVEGVKWNVSGKVVNTPVDEQKPGTINLVEDYGAGLERINIIAAGYRDAEDDVEEMKHLMQSVFYSRAYAGNKWEPTPNTRWYTEFVDDYHKYGLDLDLTVNDDPDDFTGVIEYWDQLFAEKQRTGMDRPVWQTTHSIVYDMEKLLAHLYVLEADPLKPVDTLDDDYYIAAIERSLGAIDIDPEPEPASRNAVASGGVYAKLQTKQDILASVNAGLNISIQESLSTYKPLVHAAKFNGELDNSLHIGNGSEGLRASCLLGIGNPTSGGSFYVKNTADPSPVYVTLENLAPPFPPETRTILDLVDILNDNNTFSRDAEASVYSEHFIKITSKLIGEAGNSFVYKADTQYTTEEQPEPILHPCFGMGEVQQGTLIPGRDALTNYELTVNGDKVVLDKAPVSETLWRNAKVSVPLDMLPCYQPEIYVNTASLPAIYATWNGTLTDSNIEQFVAFLNYDDLDGFLGKAHASWNGSLLTIELLDEYGGDVGNGFTLDPASSTPYSGTHIFAGGVNRTSVLKHNHVYTIDGDVPYQQDWTIQPGATAEIWLDSISAKRNIVWPSSWKWTVDGIFRPNYTQTDQPDPQQNTVTVITVRNHGGIVLANVSYTIDYSVPINE